MAIQTISTAFNPLSGVFGTGQVQLFPISGTWVVPPGIGKVRARVWGGGGYDTGSGGGFSLVTVYSLTGVTSVAVTVGAGGISGATTGGTSSFGSYCSATGGLTSGGTVGSGSGGDINNSGGRGSSFVAGGGSAALTGNGNFSTDLFNDNSYNISGGAGGGAANNNSNATSGFLGVGGERYASESVVGPTSGLQQFSIDFIGAGGGGGPGQNGINGGGGAYYSQASQTGISGGIPGGGGGYVGNGGRGLVIVEW